VVFDQVDQGGVVAWWGLVTAGAQGADARAQTGVSVADVDVIVRRCWHTSMIARTAA